MSGDLFTKGTRNCLPRSEDKLVAAIGVEDLVVIARDVAVLVVPREQAQDIGNFVKNLRGSAWYEAQVDSRVYRPWGSYRGIDLGERSQVKRITVSPGSRLSLQSHEHRAEHWGVVDGVAEVTCDGHIFRPSPYQLTYIPLGSLHRLANPRDEPLRVIEVQSGN